MSMDVPPPPPPPPPPGTGGSGPAPTAPLGNPLVGYWKQVVLERYAQFTGRARRAEYWWFTLANVIGIVVLLILSGIIKIFIVLYFIYLLALIVPSIAVAVRRLHDTDKSGWWFLIALVPFVGGIILLVLMCIDSTRGTNRYGVSEKYPAG
jgi:uncharacterized membrane protein YhaH (DUF805 family)